MYTPVPITLKYRAIIAHKLSSAVDLIQNLTVLSLKYYWNQPNADEFDVVALTLPFFHSPS